MSRLFIVGKISTENYLVWEFIGVFDTEDKAVNACIDNCYFIGPAMLNEALPDNTVDWVGSYYPQVEGLYD